MVALGQFIPQPGVPSNDRFGDDINDLAPVDTRLKLLLVNHESRFLLSRLPTLHELDDLGEHGKMQSYAGDALNSSEQLVGRIARRRRQSNSPRDNGTTRLQDYSTRGQQSGASRVVLLSSFPR